MHFSQRTTQDLQLIAAAGGGFRLEARTRSTDDLRSIAQDAVRGKATVVFSGMSARTTEELRLIAAAGAGYVIFED